MNETLSLIKSRRSVKKYKDTPVEKELIERFGEEKAAEIKSAEYYEICEFGGSLTEELKDILER